MSEKAFVELMFMKPRYEYDRHASWWKGEENVEKKMYASRNQILAFWSRGWELNPHIAALQAAA